MVCAQSRYNLPFHPSGPSGPTSPGNPGVPIGPIQEENNVFLFVHSMIKKISSTM